VLKIVYWSFLHVNKHRVAYICIMDGKFQRELRDIWVLSNNYLLNYSFRLLYCRQLTTTSAQQFSVRLFSIYQEDHLFSTELLISCLVCHEWHLPAPYRLLIAVCLLYEQRTIVTQTNLFIIQAVSGVWNIALSAHCQMSRFDHEITCLSFYIPW